MENIYGQTENERNSVVEIPEGFPTKAGNTLYSWLGSLWNGLNKGDKMVRGMQAARGIRLAQLYIDILEAARLQDRYGAPVFHRELWHPIVIRMSERNMAQENMLEIGGQVEIGEQEPGSIYGEGTVLQIGKLANFSDYVTYPIGTDIAGGAVTIVDNIVNPTVLMERGNVKDFEIRNQSIIFPKGNDPLADGSPFDPYDIPGLIDDGGKQVSDREVVLWASDVLIDKNYISDHISYALGADAPSTDVVKRILNAAWSSVASGLTPELVRTLMAAMLNVPVIQNETETVVDITREEDDDGNQVTVVRTDFGEYRLSPKTKILGGITSGTVLHRGDFLDESIRIYPFLNSAFVGYGSDSSSDGMSVPRSSFSVPVEQDIPSIVIPKSILRAKTEYGVYAMWGETDVKMDEKGRLYFDIGGTKSDVESFWNDVWASADRAGKTMEDIFGGKGVGDTISPSEFFVRNLVGANTLFVVVDTSQVDDASMMHDPMFFDMLTSVVPSGVRLFVVEHLSVGGDDVAEIGEAVDARSMSAAVGPATDVADPAEELVSMRFFRPPPEKVRG